MLLGMSGTLHSGGDCQAEPSLVQLSLGILGQVLTMESVQTNRLL